MYFFLYVGTLVVKHVVRPVLIFFNAQLNTLNYGATSFTQSSSSLVVNAQNQGSIISVPAVNVLSVQSACKCFALAPVYSFRTYSFLFSLALREEPIT